MHMMLIFFCFFFSSSSFSSFSIEFFALHSVLFFPVFLAICLLIFMFGFVKRTQKENAFSSKEHEKKRLSVGFSSFYVSTHYKNVFIHVSVGWISSDDVVSVCLANGKFIQQIYEIQWLKCLFISAKIKFNGYMRDKELIH